MQNQIIPPAFLFHYSMVAPQDTAIPRKKGRLLQLDDAARIYVPGSMNNATPEFDLKVAWNTNGLGVEIDVRGKKLPPSGRHDDLKTSDCFTIFVDTRHTANVHRATEYCSALIVLPSDDKAGGRATAAVQEIAQQRVTKRDQDGRKCEVQSTVHNDGYTLEVWVPASQLYGFSEAPEIGHIGFCCVVRDTELGDMPMTVGGDFPVAINPSTWLQLELKHDKTA